MLIDCQIFLYNRPYLQTLENSRLASLLSIPQRILNSSRFLNSLGNAQNNISAHYDISNAMFAGEYQIYHPFRELLLICL